VTAVSTPAGGFVTSDAPTRAELSACVQCGLCLPHCPTFRLTGKESASPRGRLMAMSAVLEGIVPVDEAFDEVISFCLGCRACEAVCPGLVPYGRVLEGARAELAAQRPSPARSIRRSLLGRVVAARPAVAAAGAGAGAVQALHLDRWLPDPVRRGLAGMRPGRDHGPSWVGRVVEPAGETIGTAALLAGCVMDAWFRPVHDATVGLLRRAGYRVEVPAAQTCCGALAAHDGSAGEARRLAVRNARVLASYDLVVSNAAGCSAHLKEYGHWAGPEGAGMAAKVEDVTETVARLIAEGRLPTLDLDLGPVAVQDPCHLRHAQRIVAQPRSILAAAGYRPVEVDPDGLCCGAAGTYSTLQPEASAELGRRKAEQVRASHSTVVATANPGCEMQLRAHLDAGHRVVHPVELYWEALTRWGAP
jgi:glycolate oxidase iron-sulfur subunit